MTRDIKQTVAWFLDNISLQIEDRNLERDEVTIEIYFDTVDVRRMVLGMHAYASAEGGFRLQRFNNPRSLVHCLAFSGWLGEVNMLPPHEAEFLTLLNINFGVQHINDLKGFTRKFHEAIGIPDIVEEKSSGSRRMSEDELINLVKRKSISAQKLFKAIQSRGRWDTRLAVLWREEVLMIDASKRNHNFAQILQSQTFKDVKQFLDDTRRDKLPNNFADAIAIGLLIESVQKFKAGESKVLPRFFVSTRLFHQAVVETGVAPLLKYSHSQDSTSEESSKSPLTDPKSVLRDIDYFIFKSIFRQRQVHTSVNEIVEEDVDPIKIDLNELQDKVHAILTVQEPLTSKAIEKINVSGRPLSEIINEFHQFLFLKNVWLRYFAMKDLARASELERTASDLVRRRDVDEAIKSTRRALKKSVNEYERVGTLWEQLETATKTLQARISSTTETNLDFFRDLGLLRFAFTQRDQGQIRDVLNALLSGKEQVENGARSYVVTACHINEANVREAHDLTVAAAVLWVVELDDAIIQLLKQVTPLPHYSLKLVFAAAIFRCRKEIDRGRTILSELVEEFNKTEVWRERVDLAVGIAYLYFHLWLSQGFTPKWRTHPKFRESKEYHTLISEAVRYAKGAYDLLESGDKVKRMYALNQYLYYLVEGSSDDRADQLKNAARNLVAYKVSDRSKWQYRFNDTLARYFHRLALSSDTEEDWKDWMKSAKLHIEEAWKDARGDKEVADYLSIIEAERATGFQGKKKT